MGEWAGGDEALVDAGRELFAAPTALLAQCFEQCFESRQRARAPTAWRVRAFAGAVPIS